MIAAVFRKDCRNLKLDLSEEQIQQFLTFYEYLMEKNKVMNLTGITEFQEVVEKHFLDSLCLVKAFPRPDTGKMLDLGTGSRFSGDSAENCFSGSGSCFDGFL